MPAPTRIAKGVLARLRRVAHQQKPSPRHRKMVMIITYGRSGSTLLLNILNTIKGYDLSGENMGVLLHLYRAFAAAKRTKQRFGRKGSDPKHPWYGANRVAFDALGGEVCDSFVSRVLAPKRRTKVTGFKEVRFLTAGDEFEPFLQFLMEQFPNSRFVFTTREPAQAAQSSWWRSQDFDTTVEQLSLHNTTLQQMAAKYPDRCYLVHYDDYVADPEVLKGLFRFLGEKFRRERVKQVLDTPLDHAKTMRNADPMSIGPWINEARQPGGRQEPDSEP